MPYSTGSILIFAPGTDTFETPADVKRGLGRMVAPLVNKASEVAVETLAANVQSFLAHLDEVLSAAPKEVGGMEIDEVEFHAQIDSQGNVGIASFAGAQVAMQGAISFVLRKRRE